MTLTPDQTPGKSDKRSLGAARRKLGASRHGSDAVAGESVAGRNEPSAAPATGSEPTSLREQLEAAGMDLTGNPLVGKLDSIAAVPVRPLEDCDDEQIPPGDSAVAEAQLASLGDAETFDSDAGTPTDGSGSEQSTPGDGSEPAATVPHPLLSETEWRDLDRLAPELTHSISGLTILKDELLSFSRPLGPDQAMTVVNGIETATRILEAMSAVALSVYDRCGTPADYGAKTTKALVQNRFNLTGYEANRRTELAKNLGSRAYMTGQPREPVNPIVAKALHAGVLSAGQATTINDCLSKLPFWVSAETRDTVESDLVDKAPRVRVSDLKTIFAAILDRLNPDGEEPKLPPDRGRCYVNVRARDDGTWVLRGLLDPVSGGVLSGLLTSRILPGSSSKSGQGAPGPVEDLQEQGNERVTTNDEDLDEPEFDIFRAVLAGEVADAALPDHLRNEKSSVFGVREDGTPIDTGTGQGTVRNRIYERFATMISRVEMDRIGRGSPFALVVTAKAEDITSGKGRASTGCEAEFPLSTAASEGLNGSVFFHLMSDKAKTMEISTEGRYATNRQVAILAARDQGCTFPGCDAPPGWCDAHHIVPWANEGKTDINNLTLACGLHHHLIDKSDWYARMLHDGRPAWIPPPSIDVERRPILHSRFVAQAIIDGLSGGEGFPSQ